MKRLKIIFSCAIISINTYAQKDSIKLNLTNSARAIISIYNCDTVPKLNSGNPFSGNDTTIFFSKGEKLLAIETYKQGYKIEVKTYYDNGKEERYYQFKNNKRDGISKGWYKSGQILFDEKVMDGETIGSYVSYYENGVVKSILDNQKGFTISFYDNGKMESFVKSIQDSIFCGGRDGYEETKWRKDGQLKLKHTSNCGKQTFRWYYNDTTISCEGSSIDMSIFLVGKYTEWHKNGTPKLAAYYQDGNTQSEANIKTGVWKYYNEKGKLEKEEYYENNKLIKTKEYNQPKKIEENKK